LHSTCTNKTFFAAYPELPASEAEGYEAVAKNGTLKCEIALLRDIFADAIRCCVISAYRICTQQNIADSSSGQFGNVIIAPFLKAGNVGTLRYHNDKSVSSSFSLKIFAELAAQPPDFRANNGVQPGIEVLTAAIHVGAYYPFLQ
jgi:hypothetical protein